MTEPPYFGTANEPYEPPPDRPYQPPPYEPPADRLYEPPPVESYQPPPDEPPPVRPPPDRSYQLPPVQPPPDRSYQPPPVQPPPDQPEKLRRSRRWWIFGVFVLVAIAAAIPADPFSFFDFSSDPGTSSDPAYGRSAVDVVHELHLCDNPKVDHGLATCTLADGIGYAIVTTVNDKTEQDEVAADVKDPNEGCTMVVKGYFVTGPDRATLTQALGNLDAFAAQHHGYLAGGCS